MNGDQAVDPAVFARRAETFGFEGARPWALSALSLVCKAPRVYAPLLDAWDVHQPGTKAAMSRLTDLGFVAHQPGVVIDTRSGEDADAPTRRVARYLLTRAGRTLLTRSFEDIACLSDRFPRASEHNLGGVLRLLAALDLQDSHARFGLSRGWAVEQSGMADRTGRWWVDHLVDEGLVRVLDTKYADVREVVPAHWRVTRDLTRQVRDALNAFDHAPKYLAVELRLNRRRFLDDIDPKRVGVSGATDFDHDVIAQTVLADMLRSPRVRGDGVLAVEPRYMLPSDRYETPKRFTADGRFPVWYQPDAEFREQTDSGATRRCVVEYERYQRRRDGWSHIERFVAWMRLTALPFEEGVLRFVVDSPGRWRTYVELIEAFATHAAAHPELMCANPLELCVATTGRLAKVSDPLDRRHYASIQLPGLANPGEPILSDVDHPASPYMEYFAS